MGFIQNYDDLPMNWVGDWAGRRAALTPHRTALYDSFTPKAYTFQDMNDRACRVGTYLTDVRADGRTGWPLTSGEGKNPVVQSGATLARGRFFVLTSGILLLVPRPGSDVAPPRGGRRIGGPWFLSAGSFTGGPPCRTPRSRTARRAPC